MDRRRFLRTFAVGTTAAAAGCTGGEVVHTVNRSISVTYENGWTTEIPASADKIKFVVRDEKPFDVFVFTDSSDAEQYKAYLDGEKPDRQPVGNRDLGGSSTEINADGGSLHEVKTENSARQDLPGGGPAYFAVDHSNYGDVGTMPNDTVERISPTVNLEAIESTLPI